MSDWQVGDMAVCIKSGRRFREAGITLGSVHKVAAVVIGTSRTLGPGTTGLVLEGTTMPPGKLGAVAAYFRKVRPDEREACEPEFVTLLKRSRKTVRA